MKKNRNSKKIIGFSAGLFLVPSTLLVVLSSACESDKDKVNKLAKEATFSWNSKDGDTSAIDANNFSSKIIWNEQKNNPGAEIIYKFKNAENSKKIITFEFQIKFNDRLSDSVERTIFENSLKRDFGKLIFDIQNKERWASDKIKQEEIIWINKDNFPEIREIDYQNLNFDTKLGKITFDVVSKYQDTQWSNLTEKHEISGFWSLDEATDLINSSIRFQVKSANVSDDIKPIKTVEKIKEIIDITVGANKYNINQNDIEITSVTPDLENWKVNLSYRISMNDFKSEDKSSEVNNWNQKVRVRSDLDRKHFGFGARVNNIKSKINETKWILDNKTTIFMGNVSKFTKADQVVILIVDKIPGNDTCIQVLVLFDKGSVFIEENKLNENDEEMYFFVSGFVKKSKNTNSSVDSKKSKKEKSTAKDKKQSSKSKEKATESKDSDSKIKKTTTDEGSKSTVDGESSHETESSITEDSGSKTKLESETSETETSKSTTEKTEEIIEA